MGNKSIFLPGLALIGLCLVGFSMSQAPSAVASDAEAAGLFGGCAGGKDANCGTTCAGEVHTPSCQQNCCTGTAGWRAGAQFSATPLINASCGGSNCGTITTKIMACGI